MCRRQRVPVILQTSTVECGAACLTMILNYHGRKVRFAECVECIRPGRDGTKAEALARVARDFGLRVKAYTIEPEDLKYLELPAIVHWKFNHYLVVERWSANRITVIDPAVGRRRLTKKEFEEWFTGVVLSFEPSVEFMPNLDANAKEASAVWISYLKLVLSTPGAQGLLAQILSASLILQILGLMFPVFTKIIVDQILPLRISNILPILGFGAAVFVLARAVTSYLRSVLLFYLQARLDLRAMMSLFEHLLRLPYSFFQRRNSGDLISRLSSNAVIREILTNQVLSAVLDGGLVLVYLIILLSQALSFGLLTLVIGLCQVAILLTTAPRIRDLLRSDLVAQANVQSYQVEALKGIATLKASGAEERVFDNWSNLLTERLNVSFRKDYLLAIIGTSINALNNFAPIILLWAGAYLVLNDSMSLGIMLALTALAGAFLNPLGSLVNAGQQIQLGLAHLARIVDVLEAKPEQDLRRVLSALKLTGRITLRHVSYRFYPDAAFVLRDVSARIEPGQKIAIVGPTGSGKTTLAMLILGLYEPTEGQILFDEIPLSELNYRALRRHFGIVLQEPFLFSGTIRQNIAFNNPTLSLDQVKKAARMAAIEEEIAQMPMEYETLIGEGGSTLSGGQRQRLALARAIANQPTILLLDEATSHLDVETERRVEQNLRTLHCTRIVIAHRLSTICDADKILVLNQGRIEEQGKHTELLRLYGSYSNIVRSQLETESV